MQSQAPLKSSGASADDIVDVSCRVMNVAPRQALWCQCEQRAVHEAQKSKNSSDAANSELPTVSF